MWTKMTSFLSSSFWKIN